MSDKSTKKPRLFYYDETYECWAPIPLQFPRHAEELSGIISVDNLRPDEECAIRFKRMDMTDYEIENLPEVD